MEPSILLSTKKILKLAPSYVVYDNEVLTHINSAFSTLNQLDIGKANFRVVDESQTWGEYTPDQNKLNIIKTFVFLKVRILFDPPTTSFELNALQTQLEEIEWRITLLQPTE